MSKNNKYLGSLANEILWALKDLGYMFPRPFETPYGWIKRAGSVNRKRYYNSLYQLKQSGMVEMTKKNNQLFLKLTNKGELKALIAKIKIPNKTRWDGKWRFVIFDIPEVSKQKRDQLRRLLKQAGFKKIQSSVFASPYPIAREAIEYLKKVKLKKYIKFLRVDEIDDSRDMIQLFNTEQKIIL